MLACVLSPLLSPVRPADPAGSVWRRQTTCSYAVAEHFASSSIFSKLNLLPQGCNTWHLAHVFFSGQCGHMQAADVKALILSQLSALFSKHLEPFMAEMDVR